MGEQGRGMRRQGHGLLRPWRLGLLLGVVMAVLYAPSAWAATYTVDNAGDATGQACTAGPTDCSLRSAIEQSNATTSTTDTIDFDSASFNGTLASTISTANTPGDIVISDDVNITGGNCGTTLAPKPCVRVDKTGGNNIFEIGANGVSISGIAFTGAPGAAINGNGFLNLTVTGSWFGVALDGTTLDANSSGVNTGAGATGDTVGGTTAATRNVFANNTSTAITTVNGGANTIQGNYIGTLPNGGVPASSPGSNGILIQGNASGDTIGGDAANSGSCDGACNLIVNLSSSGIVLGGGGPGPSSTNIYGNFIGLGLNGTSDQGNGGSGIFIDQPGGATNIGAAANTKRNYIAGNDVGGVSTSQANNVNIVNNYIGVTAAGTTSIKNTTTAPALGSGILFIGDGGQITNNHLGGNGITIIAQPNGGTSVKGNLIGVGPGGEAFNISGESGIELRGSNYSVGGVGAGEGNTIGNVTTVGDGGLSGPAALFLTNGSSGDTIQGNFIGTTSTGTPEPNAGWGILLGGSNGYTGDLIGGGSSASENVISNNGRDAISFNQGGSGVSVQRNVGKNNGGGAGDLFFDIGFGSANGGILAPGSLSATSTQLTGTGDNGDSVFVYATYTSHGDIRASLGSTTVSSGTWSVPLPNLPAGQCVTANQTDLSGNSSEMATAVAVGGGPCVLHPISSIDSGPAEGTATADTTPTFDFSSVESGVTFECKVDGGAFSTCTSPFTPSTPLSDDTHTFTARGLQAPSNPGLGPDVGTPVTRTFTVDTTGPVISFTSGPAEGATIDTSSASIGFSANEPATFECKLNGGSFAACTSPFSASSLSDGTHTVQVRGTDTLGNAGAMVTRTFNVKVPVAAPPGPTGQRAAALKKCKKKKSAKARKKCKAKANKLPV
jgi:hypothetical protein